MEDELGQVIREHIRHHLVGEFIECLWLMCSCFHPLDSGWRSSPFALV